MDKLAAMRAFVAIVDAGSLTAAAERLDRAPPTMVRSLAALESDLGVRLLTRTTRRMALTEEGRVYLDRCRRILSDVEEAEEAVTASGAEARGEIRATAPMLFGQRHVAPAVAAFAARHPLVRVDLLLLDRVVDLVEEGLHVGVRIGRLPDSSMIAIPVGEVHRVVVASPEVLERHGTPDHPSALSSAPCVGHHGTASTSRWNFRSGGRSLDVPVECHFSSNLAQACVDACAEGLGFGSFLSYQVEPEVRSGKLRVVLEEYEPASLPVQIVYPDARLMSQRLRLFVDALATALRGRSEIRRRAAAAR